MANAFKPKKPKRTPGLTKTGMPRVKGRIKQNYGSKMLRKMNKLRNKKVGY